MRIVQCACGRPTLAGYPSSGRRAVLVRAMVLLGIVLGLPGAARAVPVVSSHLKVLVPAGGGLVDLFTFPKPDPCVPAPCTDQRVMMAKFIVDETATDLSFELRSVTSPASKYPVTQFSTAVANVPVFDNDLPAPNNQAATVRARFVAEPVTAGFKVLTILVRFGNAYDGFPMGETWKIQANPTPGDDHYSGFRVDGATEAAADALVTRPHLINFITDAQLADFSKYVDLPNAINLDFGELHVSLPALYLPEKPLEFRNVGTAAFTITAMNPPSISLPFILTSGCGAVPAPASVVPMGQYCRTFMYQPTAQGASSSTVTLTTNEQPPTRQVNLSGKGIVLNSAVLFDVSGSMLTDKNDNFPVADTEQKVYRARIAALELAGLYKDILPKARLGLYTYPDLPGNCPNSQTLINQSVIENNYNSFDTRLNWNIPNNAALIKPAGMSALTPMGSGMQRVIAALTPKPADTRAAVFQFGDGQHYCPSNPNPTPESIYNTSQFQSAGIPFFTIPYGATGAGWLQTFQQIATKSGGAIFAADITDTLELQKQFKNALSKALDLEKLKDPKANITAGGTATHPVCVTDSTYQLVLSVHWAANNANALGVDVETPDHTMLTPAALAAHPGHVSYTSGQTYANYVVRGKFMTGGAGTGVWKIHIKGNQATAYSYQVYAMDLMKSEATFDLAYVGRAANLNIKYLAGPYAVAGASLIARYEKPAASFNNYLARTPVTPELIARAPKHLSLAEKKVYILAHLAERPFNAKRIVETYRFGELERSALDEALVRAPDPAAPRRAQPSIRALVEGRTAWGEKVYQLPFQAAQFDGLHSLLVTAKGITARDQCFERDYLFTQIVDILLTPAIMRAAVKWEEPRPKPFFDPDLVKRLSEPPPPGTSRMSVTFTPVDKAGNYWGVGRGDEVRFALKGARPLGRVMDNLDGSYTQVVEFKTETRPTASVVVGKTQSGPIPLQPIRPIPGRPTPGRPTPVAPTPPPGTPR
jgi:hypothetical protein